MKPKIKKQTPESAVLNSILKLLAMKPNALKAYRMNTGALKAEGRFIRFGIVGMADILVFSKKHGVVWIEVKSGKGKQSVNQKSFEWEVLEYSGGTYVLAHSVDDVMFLVEEKK